MGAFVITLREGFEAALIVSLILAYLAKTGDSPSTAAPCGSESRPGSPPASRSERSCSSPPASCEGDSEALYEGTAMIVAAGVVTWMAFWMRKQAATIGGNLRAQVSESLRSGGGLGARVGRLRRGRPRGRRDGALPVRLDRRVRRRR